MSRVTKSCGGIGAPEVRDFYWCWNFCKLHFATPKRFQFLSPAAHGVVAILTHRNIGLRRSKYGAARSRSLSLSYNRISERLESAKRLHRYLNFADDGNHARLDTSIARFVGFLRLGYFTIGSNPSRCGGQDRVLLVFSVDSKPRKVSFSLPRSSSDPCVYFFYADTEF